MHKKKDLNIIFGVVISVLIVILAIIGYKKSGKSVSVPQVGDSTITETQINALPTGSKILGNKDTLGMESIQTVRKDSGLIIEIMHEGSGEPVKSGDMVAVDYRGFLEDGSVFDESYKRGQTFSFSVGAGQVIAGWDEGLLGMKVGEKRRLTIPSNLAYGPNGIPGAIPGGATLIFDVELRKIN